MAHLDSLLDAPVGDGQLSAPMFPKALLPGKRLG